MILNIGSVNIDYVYRVNSLPSPGETCIALSSEKFLGGKGINQSIAATKAQGVLKHIGAVGHDGQWAIDQIASLGVDTSDIAMLDQSTGHAIIYVDDASENQIVIDAGTNGRLTEKMIDRALKTADPIEDWVLLQNETNLTTYIVHSAKEKGLRVAYAAAPFVAETAVGLIDSIDLLAVNEGEARALAMTLKCDIGQLPVPSLLLTKGGAGAEFRSAGEVIYQEAFSVEAVDTTGAGDTFLGSFLGRYAMQDSVEEALAYASAASAIQVTREGAAVAIPEYSEVLNFLSERNCA